MHFASLAFLSIHVFLIHTTSAEIYCNSATNVQCTDPWKPDSIIDVKHGLFIKDCYKVCSCDKATGKVECIIDGKHNKLITAECRAVRWGRCECADCEER